MPRWHFVAFQMPLLSYDSAPFDMILSFEYCHRASTSTTQARAACHEYDYLMMRDDFRWAAMQAGHGRQQIGKH